MRISTVKIISLLFFIFSAFYLYTAYQIQVFAFDENAPFNARTFPKLISYLGITVSFLTLVLSKSEDEPLGQYEWLKVFILFVLVFTYGIIIKSIGFFLSTNLFLLLSYYYLGVRNYKVLLLCSLPVVAVLQFMLHGLLNVYIRDPFLKLLGIIS